MACGGRGQRRGGWSSAALQVSTIRPRSGRRGRHRRRRPRRRPSPAPRSSVPAGSRQPAGLGHGHGVHLRQRGDGRDDQARGRRRCPSGGRPGANRPGAAGAPGRSAARIAARAVSGSDPGYRHTVSAIRMPTGVASTPTTSVPAIRTASSVDCTASLPAPRRPRSTRRARRRLHRLVGDDADRPRSRPRPAGGGAHHGRDLHGERRQVADQHRPPGHRRVGLRRVAADVVQRLSGRRRRCRA